MVDAAQVERAERLAALKVKLEAKVAGLPERPRRALQRDLHASPRLSDATVAGMSEERAYARAR